MPVLHYLVSFSGKKNCLKILKEHNVLVPILVIWNPASITQSARGDRGNPKCARDLLGGYKYADRGFAVLLLVGSYTVVCRS